MSHHWIDAGKERAPQRQRHNPALNPKWKKISVLTFDSSRELSSYYEARQTNFSHEYQILGRSSSFLKRIQQLQKQQSSNNHSSGSDRAGGIDVIYPTEVYAFVVTDKPKP